MNPLIWIPLLIAVTVFQSYATVKYNAHVAPWGWVLWLSALIPIWQIMVRHSTNILWDALAYDSIVFLTYGVSIGLMTGAFQAYTPTQWVGLALLVTGFFLLHSPTK